MLLKYSDKIHKKNLSTISASTNGKTGNGGNHTFSINDIMTQAHFKTEL